MTHFLILPIGAPGAGKSTLRQALLDLDVIAPEAVVSPDDYRVILTGSKGDQRSNNQVFQIVDQITYTRLDHGLDVYLDATSVDPERLRHLRTWTKTFGAEIIYVKFDIPHAVLVERNERRDHPVPPDILERYWAKSCDVNDKIMTGGRVFHVTVDKERSVAALIGDHIITRWLEEQ